MLYQVKGKRSTTNAFKTNKLSYQVKVKRSRMHTRFIRSRSKGQEYVLTLPRLTFSPSGDSIAKMSLVY